MNRPSRNVANRLAMFIGLAFAVLLFFALKLRGVSPVSSGAIVGVLGLLSLGGIVYGIWSARDMERRRKAKEDIRINR